MNDQKANQLKCRATGCIKGPDLSKMMLSSNFLSWPKFVKIELSKTTAAKISHCEQHEALAAELAHVAEVAACLRHMTRSCASCAGRRCPVPPL